MALIFGKKEDLQLRDMQRRAAFAMTDFVEPDNEHRKVAKILATAACVGEIRCRHRRRLVDFCLSCACSRFDPRSLRRETRLFLDGLRGA